MRVGDEGLPGGTLSPHTLSALFDKLYPVLPARLDPAGKAVTVGLAMLGAELGKNMH